MFVVFLAKGMGLGSVAEQRLRDRWKQGGRDQDQRLAVFIELQVLVLNQNRRTKKKNRWAWKSQELPESHRGWSPDLAEAELVESGSRRGGRR